MKLWIMLASNMQVQISIWYKVLGVFTLCRIMLRRLLLASYTGDYVIICLNLFTIFNILGGRVSEMCKYSSFDHLI